jgi:DNA polymerase delta subunit 4
MPTTRRKSAGTAKGRSKASTNPNQTKLAFHGPLSKPTGQDDAPDKKAATAKADKLESIPVESIPPAASVVVDDDEQEESTIAPTTKDVVDEDIFPTGLSTLELDEDETETWRAAVRKARGIGQVRIEKYWEAKEKERITPRVHQEEMSMHEKLLADWDIDSRYGVRITPFLVDFGVRFACCFITLN